MLSYSAVDDRNHLWRTNWRTLRERIAKAEPHFAELVDALDLDDSFAIYVLYFPYGDLKGDTISPFLPAGDGSYVRLSDPNLPSLIQDELGYGKNASPFGMILEKQFEYFADLPQRDLTMPWQNSKPGTFFPVDRLFPQQHNRVYAPNSVLHVSAGSRSVFMLPNIGCSTHHAYLQRDYDVLSSPPKAMYEHWKVFKEVVQSSISNSDWRAALIYFSKPWLERLINDPAWLPLKNYLYEKAWMSTEYRRARYYFDVIFSIIQNSRNLKPNPYLLDTAKHLFAIALGEMPGYAPQLNDEKLPLKVLQRAYVESYGLKKYVPTILAPSHFSLENEGDEAIYYSLSYPSTLSLSPKASQVASTLSELRELERIMRLFTQAMTGEFACMDTTLNDAAKKLAFHYFHSKADAHGIVRSTDELWQQDGRFRAEVASACASEAGFSRNASFLRGCVRISHLPVAIDIESSDEESLSLPTSPMLYA
jgi:hypothetical protein